mgnify:CR=1 FL=1
MHRYEHLLLIPGIRSCSDVLNMAACLGGTLEKLIEQDGPLPESCVRQFGCDLVEGRWSWISTFIGL